MMRTVTTETKVYKFSELSEKARGRARMDEQAIRGYPWADEAMESLKLLAEHFNCKLKDYEVDFFNCTHSTATFDTDSADFTEDEIRERLMQLGSYDQHTLYGYGDCKLTGYAADDDAIDGFRVAFIRDGERDIGKLLQAAFRRWLKCSQHACEAIYEDNDLSENFDANGIEFLETGEVYSE